MTKAEIAILGLVAEMPRHGYEIEEVIERRGMREWAEVGFSSIYYLLSKLEKEGMLSSRVEVSEGTRARKVYEVTGAGREALRAEVIRLLSSPEQSFSSLDVGLANLPVVSKREALNCLRTYREGLEARHRYVAGRLESQGGEALPVFVRAMFTHSLALIGAEIAWLDDLIARLGLAQAWTEYKDQEG